MIRTAHIFFYVWYYVMLFVSHEDKKKTQQQEEKKFIKLKRMNGMGSVKIISLYNGYINIFFSPLLWIYFIIIHTHTERLMYTLIFVFYFCCCFWLLLVSFYSFDSFANQSTSQAWAEKKTSMKWMRAVHKQLFRLSKTNFYLSLFLN